MTKPFHPQPCALCSPRLSFVSLDGYASRQTPAFEWLPGYDFAILSHGFRQHGRDYVLLIEDCIGRDPGRHELIFTHCVKLDYETRVRDDV